jgi:hypothetical protein
VDKNSKPVVAVLCLFSALGLILGTWFLLTHEKMAGQIAMPAFIIVGLVGMIAVTAIFIASAVALGIQDKTQALGLPEGSVRALIALSLIVVFAMTAVYLLSNPSETQKDLAKSLLATISTLVTSVAGFYFGARTAASAAASPTSKPTITKIVPDNSAGLGSDGSVQISGSDLGSVSGVKLVSGAQCIAASHVVAGADLVKCILPATEITAGRLWTVNVTASDGGSSLLPDAFRS